VRPHGKPATGKAADAARAALKQAQESPQSRLCVFARQTLAEIEGQAEFSHEERQALESLRTAIDRLSITH